MIRILWTIKYLSLRIGPNKKTPFLRKRPLDFVEFANRQTIKSAVKLTKILVEQFRTYTTQIEADNQQEAERIGRELLPSLTADTDDVTVQARAMVGI